MIIQKKQSLTLLLLCSMYIVSYGMNQTLTTEGPQTSLQSSITNIAQYVRTYTEKLFPAESACNYPKKPHPLFTYSESYSQHLQRECTVERLSNTINEHVFGI